LKNFALFIFLLISLPLTAQVTPQNDTTIIFSEIMFAGKSGNNEFIELYNTSDSKSVDLINFNIKYYTSSADIIIDAGKGTVLEPKSFAVIFEGDYDLVNGIYKNIVPDTVLILKISDNAFGSSGMSNSSDRTIQLINSFGTKLEEYTYSSNNPKGISDEKISLHYNSTSSNWQNSKIDNGTPGIRNSVTPFDFDPGIKSFSTEDEYQVLGESENFNIIVKNFGVNLSNDYQVNIYYDSNKDSIVQGSEKINSFLGAGLAPGDSAEYSFSFAGFLEGNNLFIAKLESQADENLNNNSAELNLPIIKINEFRNDIVINEIMYAPDSGMPEWIELFNRSEKNVNLNGYKLADNTDTSKIIFSNNVLKPNEYFVVSGDSSITKYFDVKSKISISDFPTLNNSGDKIILLDSLNRVIDSLQYFPKWGGNDGFSLERIAADDTSTDPANWNSSKDFLKGTPGKINSISQKDFDIKTAKILFTPEKPLVGDKVNISALLENTGKNSINYFIGLYEDTDGDSLQDIELEKLTNQNLDKEDSIIVNFNYSINGISNTHSFILIAGSENDQDSTNNRIYKKLTPGYPQKSLVINEIMYDPSSNEPEWIELFNNTNQKINIKHWEIENLIPSISEHLLAGTDYYLNAGDYLIIAADSTFFGKHEKFNSNIIITDFGYLNNNFDGISIKDINNNLIDSVVYSSDWGGGNGFSLERFSPSQNSNNPMNWNTSRNLEGSTPGKINSISRKDFDVAVSKIIFDPDAPLSDDDVDIYALVKNPGKNTAVFSLSLYEDYDGDSLADNTLENIVYNSLGAEDSSLIKFSYKIKRINKNHNFIVKAEMDSDQDTTNNISFNNISPGYRKGDLVINEIMYNPTSREPEWIELHNNSSKEINLKNWNIVNLLPSPVNYPLEHKNELIAPDNFLVIVQDSSFYKFYPDVKSNILVLNFGSLNNSMDGLALQDNKGTSIDSLIYNDNWGGNNGFSLERISYSNESIDSTNWRTSISQFKGTPGEKNSIFDLISYKKNSIVVNEIMFDPGPNNSEFIEFLNIADKTINLGGWHIQDEKNNTIYISKVNREIIPDSYFVAAADSSIFNNYQFSDKSTLNILNISSLNLSNNGEVIILKDAKDNSIDSVKYFDSWHNSNFINTKNKSLERINPYLDGNDKNNWSTSTNVIGASPGKRNSIFTTTFPGSASVTVSPNPFSPDNDGYQDFTIIKYSINQPVAQMKVKIFDSHGRLVRTILNNSATGSNGSVIFNGLDDDNNPLRIGIYIALVEAVNESTGVTEKIKVPVVVAKKF